MGDNDESVIDICTIRTVDDSEDTLRRSGVLIDIDEQCKTPTGFCKYPLWAVCVILCCMNNITIEKLLKNIIIGGLFLIPFLPFIVSGSMFFPFITGKNFAFRIIIEIVFALWLALVIFDKSYLPKKSNLLISVVSFVGIIALADFLGANTFKSFWSNYERMEGLVSLLHLLTYFVMLITVFNEKIWKYFFNTIFASSIGLFIYGALQLAGKIAINQGGVRLDATFGNTSYFAVHMLFVAFLSGLYFFRGKIGNNFSSWFYGSISLISVFMLMETATRGTAIGLFMGIVAAAAIVARLGKDTEKKPASFIIGGVVAILLAFLLVKNIPAVKNHPILGRFAELSVSSLTSQPRYMVWNMAYQGFKERPILGWGQENFNVVFNKYYDPQMYTQEPWFDRAHNVFFDWLIAGGLLGLLSYLSIFLFSILAVWKSDKAKNFTLLDRAVLTGLLGGYFIHNFFVFDNLLSYIMFFAVVAYIYHETSGQPEPEKKQKATPLLEDEFGVYVATSLIIVSFCACMYFVNIKPIMASRSLIQALSSKTVDEAVNNFKKVFSYNTFGTTEGREQLTQRSMSLARSQGVDMMSKQTFFTLATEEMAKQIEKFPGDARYRVFQGALYSSYGLNDNALKELEEARKLSPKKQMIMFEMVSLLLREGRNKEALDLAKEAFQLEESYQDARIIYAVALIYNKDDKAADELLSVISDGGVIVDDRLINAYAAVKQFDKVIVIWQKKIEAEPKNAQYHVYLSAAYLADGQREKSVEELKNAAELDPSFADQANAYIRDIRAGKTPQ